MSTQWEYQGITRVHLRRKLSLAVQVIDDFTGLPITTGDVRVEAAQMFAPPVRKADGYFLFMNSPESVLDITARSWAYYPAALRVELAQLDQLNPVVKLRLTPNRSCRLPLQTTCLDGVAPAGSTVQVFCENDPRPLRLLYDYRCKGEGGGYEIRLYDPAQNDLEGRGFVLLRKDDENPEFFTVQSATREEGGYLLSAPLKLDAKKAGTTILPLMTVQAEENGRFFLPIKPIAVKTCVCRVRWSVSGDKWQERSIELEPGKVTRINLTEG